MVEKDIIRVCFFCEGKNKAASLMMGFWVYKQIPKDRQCVVTNHSKRSGKRFFSGVHKSDVVSFKQYLENPIGQVGVKLDSEVLEDGSFNIWITQI